MRSKPSRLSMYLIQFKSFISKIFPSQEVRIENNNQEIAARLDRLERNYIILLKRILEIDGIQIAAKANSFTSKIMSTPSDDFNKGLNEPEPTIH